MNLAQDIEESNVSIACIQGGASNETLEPILSKYEQLTDLLGQDHQLVLGVLDGVEAKRYKARTPVKQSVLDRVVLQGPSLLRMVDRDMLQIAFDCGNVNDNGIYHSLVKLRVGLMKTISHYARIVGTA